MGERSVIEWTDSTWNPWRGCDKVSEGCDECYMFRDQRRYGRDPEIVTRCADGTFYAPLRKASWKRERDAAIAARGRHLVFTCSWSDWFHPAADEWRDEAWRVIRETPESTYQILTKRPRLIPTRLPDDWGDGYPNVWLGVTIETRRWAYRADLLRAVPAAVRFISAEPLLGPLVGGEAGGGSPGFPRAGGRAGTGLAAATAAGPSPASGQAGAHPPLDLTSIDWLISGGESGGPVDRRLVDDFGPKSAAVEWVRDLRDACDAAGVAFFHKQWGGSRPESNGRLLDGRTYDEFPSVATSQRAA